jgi:hypothetical protein
MPAKRDTGGHILTEWPFCYVKSAIEHKRRYAHHFLAVRTSPVLAISGLLALLTSPGDEAK